MTHADVAPPTDAYPQATQHRRVHDAQKRHRKRQMMVGMVSRMSSLWIGLLSQRGRVMCHVVPSIAKALHIRDVVGVATVYHRRMCWGGSG